MPVFLISVPFEESKEITYKRVKRKILQLKKVSCNYFDICQLKHGSLDSLMRLSDELIKHDREIEQIIGKIVRTLVDVTDQPKEDYVAQVVLRNNMTMPCFEYLKQFEWDRHKYLPGMPLTQIVPTVLKRCKDVENKLREKQSSYSTLKTKISQLKRKNTGSLLVRPLDGIIKKEVIVESEYLTTLYVVVPSNRKKEWMKNYEAMDGVDFVVPDSTILLMEENDYCLFSVVLVKKVSQDFCSACAKRKFIVRAFKYDEEREKLSRLKNDQLEDRVKDVRRELFETAKNDLSESFISWVHLKAVRVHVESVLRYGLPPNYVTFLIQMRPKDIKNVHKVFRAEFGDLIDQGFEKLDKKVSSSGGGQFSIFFNADYHPYVVIKVDDSHETVFPKTKKKKKKKKKKKQEKKKKKKR